MNEFNLTDHEWLASIYEIRKSWIPAYYRHERMSSLMRTSSRSKSENHFFGQFCNPMYTLVEFLAHFDSAIETQRHEHRKNDHDTKNTVPKIWSEFVLEKQAAAIYTRTIFFDAQLEIQVAIHSCKSARYEEVGDFIKFYIKDWEQLCISFYEVMIRKEDMTVFCSCNRYEQYGLLCCHIFWVLRFSGIREFPKQYILRLWTREAVPNNNTGVIIIDEGESDRSVDVKRLVGESTCGMESIVNNLVTNFEALCAFKDHVNQFHQNMDEAQFNAPRKT